MWSSRLRAIRPLVLAPAIMRRKTVHELRLAERMLSATNKMQVVNAATFSVYFDESGTPDKSRTVLTVAGCVSSVKKWARFEVEWRKVLRDAGLPDGTLFHMNRFARNLSPYDIFAGNSKRKAGLVTALVGCAKRNVNKAFSCSVALRDWERINGRYCFAESLGYPYPFCGRTCVAQVLKWAQNKGVKSAGVHFFFEDGAKHRGQLEKLLMANDGIGPLFRSKAETVQFQAADLLAWKSRKILEQVIGYDGPNDAEAYNSIQRSLEEIKGIPHDYGVHIYESLERLVQRAKIPLRSRK
jgi:hypothetical protein